MSKTLCIKDNGGGGSRLKETVLWTNPSPTSNFSSQTIQLSDDVANYGYIKVVWNKDNSSDTGIELIINASQCLINYMYPLQKGQIRGDLGWQGGSGYVYRPFGFPDSTHITFEECRQVGHTTVNQYSKPTSVIGIK